jgi:m7GpppX diphosphatase
MNFKLYEILENNNKYLCLGKIDNQLAIILSDFFINDFDNILINSKIKNKVGNCYEMKNKTKNFELFYPCDKDCFDPDESKYIVINETKDDYLKKIKPYIEKIYFENTKWIYNIFDKKAEQENVIFRNDNFLICKDIGWINDSYKDFYILGFPFKNIKNIRDLRNEDVNTLKEMKKQMIVFASNYDLQENNLYFFFHYHPSFYHLHLHCSIITNKELSNKYLRHYMLDEVIKNLEKESFYYYNNTLTFEIPDYHIICKL